MTASEKLIREINEMADFLNENFKITRSVVLTNKTVTTYKVDNFQMVVKRDANTHAYSVQILLKNKGTIFGYLDEEEILASSEPDGKVPF